MWSITVGQTVLVKAGVRGLQNVLGNPGKADLHLMVFYNMWS